MGAYQLTPVHRQSIETYAYAGPGAIPLKFIPLATEVPDSLGAAGSKHLIIATWFDSGFDVSVNLIEGVDFTVAGSVITMLDLATTKTNPYTNPPAPINPPGHVRFYYTHSGF